MTETRGTAAPRMTKQRAAILDALDAGEFRSAQSWHEHLRSEGSAVGLATVYRGLQALADSGDVDTVITESGEMLYRRCGTPDVHHHHLRCRSCGKAVEIDMPDVEAFASSVAHSHGYTAIGHTIELTGICPDCADRT